MRSFVFQIFAPVNAYRKLASLGGVVLILAFGVGVFLCVQSLLTNYQRELVLFVLEPRTEISVMHSAKAEKGSERKKLSLQNRIKIPTEEEKAIVGQVRAVAPFVAASPVVSRDEITLFYQVGGRNFRMKGMLLGVDFDDGKVVVPILDQVTTDKRSAFSSYKEGANIPMFISTGLCHESVSNGEPFAFTYRKKAFTGNILCQLNQNAFFPNPVIIVPANAAKVIVGNTHVSDYIGVRTDDTFGSAKVAKQLESSLGEDFLVSDWSKGLGTLDGIFQSINIIVSTIVGSLFVLSFLFAVATFDILIKRKKKQLALLLAIGLSPKKIRKDLLSLGAIIGLVGLAIGCVFAIAFLKIVPVSPFSAVFQSIHLEDFSLRLSWGAVVAVGAISLAVPVVSAWIASKRVFKIDPIEDLRK